MKTPESRRTFLGKSIKSSIALGAMAGLPKLMQGREMLQAAEFKQDPLPYSYQSLMPYIDSMTMEIHYTKHAATYTKNLNEAAAAELKAAASVEDILKNISAYSPKMRNNGGGHYNHELFWKCMQPSGVSLHEGPLKEALTQAFGSVDQFKAKFTEAAMTRFGSGWAWLYLDEKKSLQIGSTPNQDNPLMDVSPIKGIPLLGLDVWEHAYYLKYQNKRAEYISNWYNIVNWKFVEKRLVENR